MLSKVSGVVLRRDDRPQGDALVWLLTKERGMLVVSLPRHTKKALFAVSELFCYGEYVLYEKKEDAMPQVREIDLYEAFLPLRQDYLLLALGGYFCEAVREAATSEPDTELQRLLLNALYALTVKTYDRTLVKAVFEFRLASMLGFHPDVLFCAECGKEGDAPYYLDVMNGHYICASCRKLQNELTGLEGQDEAAYGTRTVLEILTPKAMAALRYCLSCPLARMLSFRLEGDDLRFFAHTAEAYLLNHLERSFRSLEFYKQCL